jgi:recombinational DNA repair ATPase RecF
MLFNMIKIKQLAIFMDDTHVLLMELYNHMIVSRNIVFKSKENEEFIEYNNLLPVFGSDVQQHQLAYYKEISNIIRNYQQVLIFGPVNVENEFYKLLEADHHFKKIKLEIVNTKVLNEVQIHEFVLNHYK